MNDKDLKKLTAKSLGWEKAELVLKNAQVINVFSEEILVRDVAVEDGMIVGVGQYQGREEVDLSGKYLCPGFIDAHLHLESTLVAPPELIHSALQWGTTTFIIDPMKWSMWPVKRAWIICWSRPKVWRPMSL